MRNHLARLFCLALLFSPAGLLWAIPPTLNISGRLLDRNGTPVRYYQDNPSGRVEIPVQLTAELKFYDTQTTTTASCTLPATAKAYQGYFGIIFTPPDSLLTKDSLYYSLSIDADQNGLTTDDAFPDRFQVSSVPFALSAKPSTFFTTHHGMKYTSQSSSVPAKYIMLSPFETPPGGVEFNTMDTFIYGAPANSKFSFGIYDQQGTLVVSSGPVNAGSAGLGEYFVEANHQKIKLQPSTTYYAAVMRSSTQVSFLEAVAPPAPVYGIIDLSTTDGTIPASVDLTKLIHTNNAIALPITLSLHQDTMTVQMAQKTGPSKPQVRLIKADTKPE